MIADMPVKGTLSSLPVRLTYSAVCITVAVLLALGVNRANADIGDSDRLGFFPDSVEWITRNLVEGTPIPVCSEHYPKATRMAADRWNAALGITAFRMLQAGVGCYDIEIPEDGWDPQKGVVRLVVSQGTDPRKSTCPAGETIVPCMKYRGSFAGVYPDSYDGPRGYGQPIGCELYRDEEDEMGKVKQSMDRAALGCIMFDHQGFHDDDWLDNRELQTYYGRAEIFLHPRHHPRANDGTDSKSAELIRDIAHEMGHALGLADYYCGGGGNDGLERDGEPENRSLMNSWTVNRECNSLDDAPTARDLRDYTTVYTPATVTNPDSAARAEPLYNAFWLTWTQDDVFVESGFEVQRWNGTASGWTSTASTGANALAAAVENQPAGLQRYRIVARTHALPDCPPEQEVLLGCTPHGHVHGATSSEVRVLVRPAPLPAPTDARATSPTATTLTLSWIAPANTSLYKLAYTVADNCDAADAVSWFAPSSADAAQGATDTTGAAITYEFSSLDPSTTYRLCVRSIRETAPGFEIESGWVEAMGTTAALPLPTSLTVRDVTDSKAILHWNKATGADGYEVQLDGADVETTLGKNATSYEFTLRSADTAYQLGVAAKHGDQLSAFATLTLLKPPSDIEQSTTAYSSVKYTWTDGNPTGSATSAEVKIGATGTRKTADSTTYHTFKDLTANEEYTFYFRLKNNQGPSAWRTVTVTTPPLPRLTVSVSPRSVSCYTGGSVSISWAISNGTAPYAVRVNGVNASGSRKTVTCQSTAGTQTVSVTATDASTPQRSGSASVSLTVTNPPPPPPPPTLSVSASASPTSCTTGGTVNVRWSVSGASGSYTVTVDGRSASTSPTSFTCQSTAGRQSITVEVRDSNGSSESDTVYVTVTAPPSLLDCLSAKVINDFASWIGRASHCGSTTASALWTAFRNDGIQIGCIQRVGSKNEPWPKYQSGWPDFSISFGAILALTTAVCDAGGGVSGSADADAVNCAEAVKPETGAMAIDVSGFSCVIVRGGGAVQVSRGEYTLNVSLASDRDWFAFAPASYTGSSAGAFLFLDLTSGGWIALKPTDGAELERHAPADATGLPALLDAIAASAAPSVYPAPDR